MWFARLLNVFRESRVSRDIDRELAFHLAEREDELVASGMGRDAARVEARRRFGRPTALRERTRDVDVAPWLDATVRDVQYAVRALRASRGFTAVAVLSLALGIGANTAIFSLINAVMLRDLPVREPERLALVVNRGGTTSVFTNPLWEEVRDHQDAFESVLAFGDARFDLAESGESRPVDGYWVSGGFFATLGVGAALGRTINPSDDVPGCPAVAAVSHAYWQGLLGSDRNVLGRTLDFDGQRVEIVGVVEPRFTGLERGRAPQFFLPLCAEGVFEAKGGFLQHRSWWLLQVIGRLRDGETVQQATDHLARTSGAWFAATLPPNWSAENQRDYLERTLSAEPSLDSLSQLQQSYAGALLILMGIVGIVLLIACANVANLMLARSAGRHRELAVRVALGAGSARLVRQLFTEGLLLSIVGGAAGVVLAVWGSRGLVRLLSSSREAVMLDLGVDLPVLAFTGAVAVATAILFGIAPAWRAARVDPQAALKAQGRGTVEGQGRHAIGKVLVVAQVALSLVLVTCAGLLLGSFRAMATADTGFDHDGVLVASADLHIPSERRSTQQVEQRRILDRLRAMPEVKGAALAYTTPLGNRTWNDVVQVPGASLSEDDALTYINLVSDEYFSTMAMRLLAGRDVGREDTPSAPAVAVVNETAARRFWPGHSPLGKSFTLKRGDGSSPAYLVVGVVRDAKYESLREPAPPTAFFALAQDTSFFGTVNFVVRGAAALDVSRTAVMRAFAEEAPRATLQLRPLSAQVSDAMRRERLLAALSGVFGALALLLAMLGLYGTMSYNVARRRGEIGIRLALGAARARVMRGVLAEVMRVLAVGVAVGVAGVIASTRLLSTLLFGVTPRDPAVLAGSAALLTVVALVAGVIPAGRASRMDPMETLRAD